MKNHKRKGEGEAPMYLQFFLLFTFFFCILQFTSNNIQEKQVESVLSSNEFRIEAELKESDMNEQTKILKRIALTFDDGPSPDLTPKLLDGLKERNVKASFFVLGKSAEENPDLIKRMHEEGHLIGNHTYHHIQLTNSNRELFKSELKKTNEGIEKITGDCVEFVRPPYGSWDKSFEQELSMFPVLWTVDPLDWCSGNVDCITQRVISKAEDNAIILLHDTFPTSVTAALQIIDILQKQDYEFVTVDQILFD